MNATKSKIPSVRFPEFSSPWEEKAISRVLEKRTEPVDVKPDTAYRQIGLRSHGKGIFHKSEVTGKALGNKRVFWVQPDCLVLNIIFAWEQAVGKTSAHEAGMIASHRFPMYGAKKGKADIDFIVRSFLRPRGKHLLGLASPGGAGRNRTLGQKDFEKLQLTLPTLPEQRKIADFLTAVDGRIGQLSQKKALLEDYKKGVMQQLFTQALRFKDDHGNDFPDWEEKTLGAISKCFSGGTPSSGKREYYGGSIPFIRSAEIAADSTALFLTEKGLKESAAKMVEAGDLLVALYGANSGEVGISKVTGAINQAILCVRTKQSVRFLYYWLEFSKQSIVNTYLQGGQGNLSGKIVQALNIEIPSLTEQTKIANFLTALDRKIESVSQQITHTQAFKKGLLQQMFV
jgi:type I restriction enzyme S subunit